MDVVIVANLESFFSYIQFETIHPRIQEIQPFSVEQFWTIFFGWPLGGIVFIYFFFRIDFPWLSLDNIPQTLLLSVPFEAFSEITMVPYAGKVRQLGWFHFQHAEKERNIRKSERKKERKEGKKKIEKNERNIEHRKWTNQPRTVREGEGGTVESRNIGSKSTLVLPDPLVT